jgi:aspartyl protease family protein
MSGRSADLLLYAMLLILPVAALIARRPPLRRTLLFGAAWIAIFVVGLLIAGQRDRLRPLLGRSRIEGRETRIAMASDGHFWADVTIDGVTRQMLVDSGATTTAISEATARAAKLEEDSPFPIVLETANGQITARTATAARVTVGDVTTHDLHVAISANFGNTDVLGMNFLSRLRAWRVEGQTLVLVPTASPT